MLNDSGPRREAQFTRRSGESRAPSVRDTSGRREHARYSVDLEVSVTSEHNFYAGFVENLSVGGVFIATHQLKPVGERLEFSVRLPNLEHAIRGTGEVRWVRVYSEGSDVPPGMGIKFDALDEASQRSIESFLAQREPLFYDEG